MAGIFDDPREPRAPVEARVLTDHELLQSIDKSLRSIRSMLTFFVVLALIAILVAGCNTVLTLGR